MTTGLPAVQLSGDKISLLDATDKLETADAATVEFGLHAQLALLETLVYPTSTELRANNTEAGFGSIEIVAMVVRVVAGEHQQLVGTQPADHLGEIGGRARGHRGAAEADVVAVFASIGVELRLDRERWRDRN